MRISTTDLVANDAKLQYPYNPDEPLKSLCTRLNECVNYATAAGETFTKGNIFRITYGLVVEMVQFQEDYRT